MQEFMISLIEEYGYISLCFLMILENVFPPIPSEVILTFAGFMTQTTYFTSLGIIVVGTLGAYIGSLILYGVGRCFSIEKLEAWLEQPMIRVLHFQKKDMMKTQDWFFKHGKKAVFIGRLVPVIRSLISIPAGLSQMSFLTYSLYTLLGTLLWNSLLVMLGRTLGSQWHLVSAFMGRYKGVWLFVFIGGCLIYMMKKK